MKVLTFHSDYFDRKELDTMSDGNRIELAQKGNNKFVCNIYNSIADFQEAFNRDYVSDQCFIYFVNL